VCFYAINAALEPESLPQEAAGEAVLLVNYFGLKHASLRRFEGQRANLIMDQCQALFSPPLAGLGTVYSPRKFVGVADGGYLHSDCDRRHSLPVDESYLRYQPYLQRADSGARAAYAAYREVEQSLGDLPPARMSALTARLLASVDYAYVVQRRRANYALLHAALADLNQLVLPLDQEAVPLVYPLLIDVPGLRDYLIGQNVFVAQYWPDPDGLLPGHTFSRCLADKLIPLPIDQRYGAAEMQHIVSLVYAGVEVKSRYG
jgi:hypothetical protein